MTPQAFFDELQVAFGNRDLFGLLGDLVPECLDIPNLFSLRKLTESRWHLNRCFRHGHYNT